MPARFTHAFRLSTTWLLAGGAVLLALACYGPVLTGGLLWDDPAHVTRPELQSLGGLWRIWTDVLATQQYYPVLHTAFWIEHQLWGDSTFGYHLINVVQHALAACLLALAVRRLWDLPCSETSGPRLRLPRHAEWIGAALFLVHPVAVESVAWITEQKNTLSLVFYLGAALAYLRFAEKRTKGSYLGSTLLFALALGTKTVTATLPAALLVALWWRRGRLDWRRDVVPLLPWFVLALIGGLGTAWIEKNLIGAEGEGFALSLIERTLLASRIVWFYLGKLAWPGGLAFFYPLWDVSKIALSWWPYLAAGIVATVALFLLRGRTRGPLALWLLYVGSLFPALGFFNVFPFAFSYVADHFQYLASAVFLGGAGAGMAAWIDSSPRWVRVSTTGGFAVAVVILATLSRLESRHYRNNEALFTASLEHVPENWMAHRVLGWALSKQPRRDREAIEHYRRSLELKPDSPDTLHGLAVVLGRTPEGRAEAADLYRRAIALRPHFAESHHNLGLLLMADPAQLEEAVSHFEAALAAKPGFDLAREKLAEAHQRLADRFAAAGRTGDAVTHYRAALAATPNLAPAHYNLANALARQPGGMPEAIEHFRATVRLAPDSAEAHANLANALATTKDGLAEALKQYAEALRINPNLGWVHFNLALHLANVPGRDADAFQHAHEALRLDPQNADAFNGVAALYAQKGRLDEARQLWQQALSIDPDHPTARENLRRLDQLQRQR